MRPDETVEDLVAALEGYVATLERYAREVPWSAFVSSEDEQNKVLFGLHKAIQTSIDVAQLVLAERGLGPPATYREAFLKLGSSGLIDEDLAGRLADWAGLRNVIVHIYRIVDLEQIHRAYAEESGDLRAFIEAMRHMEGSGPAGPGC